MPFQIEGFFKNVGGGKKPAKWSSHKKGLDDSNHTSYELMPAKAGLDGLGGRCSSPVRDLVLDGMESSYIVSAVLSCVSSAGEKVESEPWNGDMYVYVAVIAGMFSTVISYAFWYKKLNGDRSCQECNKWY